MSPYHSHAQGRRMSSLAHSSFGSPGVLFHSRGSLSPSLKILGIILKKQTYKRALERRYLERTCVHACIQLCTHVYTHPSSVGSVHLAYLCWDIDTSIFCVKFHRMVVVGPSGINLALMLEDRSEVGIVDCLAEGTP